MSRGKKINDPVFYTLANNVAKILEENGVKKISKSEYTKIQKAQVERMMELEEIFRKTINSYKQSDKIYQKFLMHIKIERGNILTARPFFRENSESFGKNISPTFKANDSEGLKKFHINYKLIVFIISNWKGNLPKKAVAAWEEHQIVRQKIIENSMPLAINVAMKFYRAVPRNHDTLLDMINLAAAGLCIGTDKWVGPFRTVFRSVCIGRMKSNIMDVYNQTLMHYYPSDKKIIYKANLLKSRNKIEDPEVLLKEINSYLKEGGDKRVLNSNQLSDLLNGASMVSVESEQDDSGFTVYDTHVDAKGSTEDVVEKRELVKNLTSAYGCLSTVERKILKLKGVEL